MFELNWSDVKIGNGVLVGDSKGEVLLITETAIRIQWSHLDSPRNYSKTDSDAYGFVYYVS